MKSKLTALDMAGRRPVIIWGQSNAAGGYNLASEWPIRLQHEQEPIAAQLLDMGVSSYTNATWHRIKPWTVSGTARANWAIDLADSLHGLGIHPAIVQYAVGNTSISYWTPGDSGTEYPAIIAWTLARIAELNAPLDPVLVFYQGESGTGDGDSWATHMTAIAAQARSDLGCATMPIVAVQIPGNSAMGGAFRASQAAWVTSDSYARLAHVDYQSFNNDIGAPLDVHIDQAGGRRLVIGPDGPTVKCITTCIRELLA